MNKARITERNLDMLEAILRYRVMSTEQVHKLILAHLPNPGSTNSVANTLRKLHNQGYVSRTWAARSVEERHLLARPAAIWYMTKENFNQLEEELGRSGRADRAEDLADLGQSLKNSGQLAENTLRHELAISDFYVALEQAYRNHNTKMPVWVRSSPKHADISRNVTFTKTITDKTGHPKNEHKITLPLNPDGFHVLQVPNKGCAFFFLEMDMATETLSEKLTNKFLAYYAYHEQKTFGLDIAQPFSLRYRLPANRPEAAPFRVLFVTTNEKRRNDLLLKSRLLPTSHLFHFATLSDILTNPLGQIWLCKESFREHLAEYDRRTHIENQAILRKWAHELLNTAPKYAL